MGGAAWSRSAPFPAADALAGRADTLLRRHQRHGPTGVRDAGALEGELGRPINRWAYGEDDPSALAASDAFGIARNHPFVDGNKRTAWVAARLFLSLDGHALSFAQQDPAATGQALAAGELGEDEVTDWLRDHTSGA